jgi:hypothetical protein
LSTTRASRCTTASWNRTCAVRLRGARTIRAAGPWGGCSWQSPDLSSSGCASPGICQVAAENGLAPAGVEPFSFGNKNPKVRGTAGEESLFSVRCLLRRSRVSIPGIVNRMSQECSPHRSKCRCALRFAVVRACLTMLGLALAPTFGGARARAGYLPGDIYCCRSDARKANSLLQIVHCTEWPVQVVAGISRRLEADGEEQLEDGPWPWLNLGRHAGAEPRPGSGRPLPVGKVVLKRPPTPDEVFFPILLVLPNFVVQPAALGVTLNLDCPRMKRLFRPPRPAPC